MSSSGSSPGPPSGAVTACGHDPALITKHTSLSWIGIKHFHRRCNTENRNRFDFNFLNFSPERWSHFLKRAAADADLLLKLQFNDLNLFYPSIQTSLADGQRCARVAKSCLIIAS